MIKKLNFDLVCNYNAEHKTKITVTEKIECYGAMETMQRAAEEKGWMYYSDGIHYCPECKKELE